MDFASVRRTSIDCLDRATAEARDALAGVGVDATDPETLYALLRGVELVAAGSKALAAHSEDPEHRQLAEVVRVRALWDLCTLAELIASTSNSEEGEET